MATGDVILFTGLERVRAIGRVGCQLRSKSLADALWTPHGSTGRIIPGNVYTILDFQPQPDLKCETIRKAAGYKPDVNLTIPRVLSPDRAKALIAMLRLNSAEITIATDLGRDTHGSAERPGQDAPAVPAARTPAGSGQLGWTREEITLAMDAVQAGSAHGMTRISQADAAVWHDFIDNLDTLHAEAAAVRQRLAEGALAPASTAAPAAEDVPIENRNAERFTSNPSGETREAERAEAALVHRYVACMAAKGIAASRKRYRSSQPRPMFCDLWVQDRHALIEAKSSGSRERLRMAIGQLYDYRRFHEPPVHLAVLLPRKPAPDGLALLQSAGIEAIWPCGTGFRDSANGTFVLQATAHLRGTGMARRCPPIWAPAGHDQSVPAEATGHVSR